MASFHQKRSLDRGMLQVVGDNKHSYPGVTDKLVFQFNPTQLQISAKTQIDQPAQTGGKTGTSAPQWIGSIARTITFELVFDEWENHNGKDFSVTKAIQTLVSWTKPTSKSTGKQKPNPPAVRLFWGPQRMIVDGVPEYPDMFIREVKYTYTMFDEGGKPLRAKVSITGQEVPDPRAKQNPSSGGRAGRDSHLMVEGDSLHSVAHQYYGAPKYWRGLAEANRVDDPLRVRPGMSLYIPPIDELAGK